MAQININLCDDLSLNDFTEYLNKLDELNKENKHLVKDCFISVEPIKREKK